MSKILKKCQVSTIDRNFEEEQRKERPFAWNMRDCGQHVLEDVNEQEWV